MLQLEPDIFHNAKWFREILRIDLGNELGPDDYFKLKENNKSSFKHSPSGGGSST